MFIAISLLLQTWSVYFQLSDQGYTS